MNLRAHAATTLRWAAARLDPPPPVLDRAASAARAAHPSTWEPPPRPDPRLRLMPGLGHGASEGDAAL